MLRIQSALPERYTDASPDDVEAMIRTAKATLGDRLFILGHQGVDRFGGVKETRPGRIGDGSRQRSLAGAAVEGVAAVPEGLPGGAVGRLEGADLDHVGGSNETRRL